jgi:myo-inositol-1(or 4)-monophosphatase
MQATFRKIAITAAKEAGKIQLKYFGKGVKKRKKEGDTFVTKVDFECIKKVRKIICKSFPHHDVLDEEMGSIKKESDYRWIIDPLDGTHNFIMNNPLFGVSIALERKKEIILGVVYMPCLDRLYTAQKGRGAFCNQKKIHVNNEANLKNCLFLFDVNLRKRTKIKLEYLKKLSPITWRLRNFGAAIYNIVSVAQGDVSFAIDFDSNPWDHSAAFLILEEAGGRITDLEGNKWLPETKDYLASNRKLHSKVLNVLKK